jgi:hypothetical protein
MGWDHSIAAYQAKQWARAQEVKEEDRHTAADLIRRFSERKGWPEEDLETVLAALGLMNMEEGVHD